MGGKVSMTPPSQPCMQGAAPLQAAAVMQRGLDRHVSPTILTMPLGAFLVMPGVGMPEQHSHSNSPAQGMRCAR